MAAATILSDRAVVRLSGEDVRGFVQGLVTNDVTGDLPVWAGLLTPQGKCLADFLVWADGNDLLLDCEREFAPDLVQRLSLYRLRRPIQIEVDHSLAVHWSTRKGKRDDATPDPRLAELGFRWIEQRDTGARRRAWLRPNARTQEWLAHRLRFGVTEGRAELSDLLWLECNAVELNGVDFKKGCFIGQENTARMNWRSKVNRRLMVVEGAGDPRRTRIGYPDLGLSVVHARIDEVPGNAIVRDWLEGALA